MRKCLVADSNFRFNGGVEFSPIKVERADPRSPIATVLLAELVEELKGRYPDWPEGIATSFLPADVLVPRGAFVVASRGSEPVGCGALRPASDSVAEIKRMYVRPSARRSGSARLVLAELERLASEFGYTTIQLETGMKQPEAMAMYTRCGYRRIESYGIHAINPQSVCFEKTLADV